MCDLLERSEHLPAGELGRCHHSPLSGAGALRHLAEVAGLLRGRLHLGQRLPRALPDGLHQVRFRYACTARAGFNTLTTKQILSKSAFNV